MEALKSPQTTGCVCPQWAEPDPNRMARDFLLWRHLRVVRARVMRHVHRLAARFGAGGKVRPVRTRYDVMMEPDWNDRTYAYCHYATYGTYLADLLDSIDCPFLFLDIGANQGLFSLIAAQNPACETIVALDPVPATHRRLQRNFAINDLGKRAFALNFGLSDRDGSFSISVNTKHSGVATLEGHLAGANPAISNQEVQLRTMAALSEHLPEHLPIFAKIDVEGHEAVVIDQILASCHASRVIGIFYEHDERWCDGARIEQSFARAGFTTLHKYGRGRHFDALAVPSRAAGHGEG